MTITRSTIPALAPVTASARALSPLFDELTDDAPISEERLIEIESSEPEYSAVDELEDDIRRHHRLYGDSL